MSDIDVWRALADELGLEFKEGLRGFLESPTALSMFGRDAPPPSVLDNPMVQALLEKVFLGAATGTYKDYEVHLFRGSKSSSSSNKANYYIGAVLLFARRLGVEFEMRPLTFSWRLGRLFSPGRYVQSGYRSFDGVMGVKSSSPMQTRRLLASKETRDAVLSFAANTHEPVVSEKGVRCKAKGSTISSEEARTLLDQLVEVARALCP